MVIWQLSQMTQKIPSLQKQVINDDDENLIACRLGVVDGKRQLDTAELIYIFAGHQGCEQLLSR